MQYLTFVFLFFFQGLLFSQEITVKGLVKDSLANPLPLTNVQILDSNSKSLAYVTTNNEGLFEIRVNFTDNLSLKISSFGYETKTVKISAEKTYYVILLKEKITTLNEIKITADFRDVTEKNDTISYNLKRLLNGSEISLKDVVKKLPGLNIDDNGKINYNGKKIDNILIEGDELYDNQHQLATENIKSEMIEKIDLLKNHQDLSSIKGFGDHHKTALNISLKEQYKNTINAMCRQNTAIKRATSNTIRFITLAAKTNSV